MIGMGIDPSKQSRDFCMIQSMVKLLGSVTSFKAKKDRTTQHTTQQKNKTPKTLGFQGIYAERQGLELFGDILSYLGKSFVYGDNIILFPYIYPI